MAYRDLTDVLPVLLRVEELDDFVKELNGWGSSRQSRSSSRGEKRVLDATVGHWSSSRIAK